MATPMHDPEFIYKIATAPVFEEARRRGVFTGMPIDVKDGYLHFSTATQLPDTLALHFAGQDDLVLLSVRPDAMEEGALRWEPSRGGVLFPHVHGSFPMSAVVRSAPIAVGDDGSCTLPEWVR